MNPICFALDVPNSLRADQYVGMLEDHVGAFKIGLELFMASRRLPETKRPIILDLKLHDIPETVARAVKIGGDMGVKYMTLHVQQKETLERALRVAEPYGMTLLGVTVLTSMTGQDLLDLSLETYSPTPNTYEANAVATRVGELAVFGHGCGLNGFVCSPNEVEMLRGMFPDAFFLVPGIRPAGADVGDQKRVGTPAQAVKDGASLLVIGRPIRDANDPVASAKSILQEIQGASLA